MKNVFVSLIFLFAIAGGAKTQVFQIDTLQYKGDINRYINIVIMGDGYTATEQDIFHIDAGNLFQHIFSEAPWSDYISYFNVFAIRVVSAQSGAKHPNTASDCATAYPEVPVTNPDTYFGSTFDYFGIHRLVVPVKTAEIVSVLADNFPNYDQVFILVNSTYYGGSGGAFATATVDSSSLDIASHEVGHSFANLADEYYAGDVYAAEKSNMTQVTDPLSVKWKNWSGINGTGIYQHCCGGNSALWYRPHNNCKMRYLGTPYCSVCNEAIIETIHDLANPLVSYIPSNTNITSSDQFIDFKLTEVMRPVTHALKVQWKLDASVIENNVDSVQIDQNDLSNGIHSLIVTLTDTTDLLRVDNHSTIHVSTVTWTINKISTGVELSDKANKISFVVYPNPATHIINIEYALKEKSKINLQLASPDGKIIQQVENKTMPVGNYYSTISLEGLSTGIYYILLKIDDLVSTQKIVKL